MAADASGGTGAAAEAAPEPGAGKLNLRIAALCVLGGLCRLAPYLLGFSPLLAKRPELSTPLTSHFRASECVGIFSQGVSPYEG